MPSSAKVTTRPKRNRGRPIRNPILRAGGWGVLPAAAQSAQNTGNMPKCRACRALGVTRIFGISAGGRFCCHFPFEQALARQDCLPNFFGYVLVIDQKL